MLSAFTTSISPTPVRSSSPVLSHESPVAVVRALNSSLSSVEDVEGLLSLYEASHLRIHGEDILDENLPFTLNPLLL
ncbi:hypothetical protein HN51_016257 [Arachis hypogaea]